ncbi:hypothetical protein J7J58_02555 [candidate division WOR-3 bacterium]|nr:hypothetical protein [candidate division WOR-3 bacterium]
MNILLVSDAPLDESEIGYKTQNIAMEFLKHEHTVTVISFEYTKNDTHPFNSENIIFNSFQLPFEIPVYEKCNFSNTLYHNLSAENIKILRETLELKLNEITGKYSFDAVIFSHITPFLLLKRIPKIPVLVMAEIDESNIFNEAGIPEYIKIHNSEFTLIYSDEYSLSTLSSLFHKKNPKALIWKSFYNRSIFRYHEENFDEILEKYDFPDGNNVILPPLNFTNKEIARFFDIAELFSIFEYEANFIMLTNDEKSEFKKIPESIRIIHPESRFHLSVLYNNSQCALIPADKPFPTDSVFNLIASGVKVLAKRYDYIEKINLPNLYLTEKTDLLSLTRGLIKMLNGKRFTTEELKTVKQYSFQNNFNEFLNIIEETIHEYRSDN